MNSLRSSIGYVRMSHSALSVSCRKVKPFLKKQSFAERYSIRYIKSRSPSDMATIPLFSW